ncbi:MAG: PfaB family protein [Trichodesmium sp. St19_bin1]|nr:PfaB family protein [Trichodesmium sp. St19_bin1]
MNKIAIIGLSCLFPDAQTPEQYWQNLLRKQDSTSLATEQQMGVDANVFYTNQKGITDKYYCLKGGYIKDFKFDTKGYQIAPDILENLDQLYQWSIYVAKEALKDSGYLDNFAVLKRCGVILGNLSFPTRKSHSLFAPIYHQAFNSALKKLLNKPEFTLANIHEKVSDLNSNISGYPASIIAQSLRLSGINFSLDAACASSLYSIKIASDYLLANKADLMLAGAVSCGDSLFIHQGFSIFQAYPENHQTSPLNKLSGGLLSGEGAGMVVLKRYENAIRDNDRVYATINGIGLSNDGKGKFILQPNSKGQTLALERAYNQANINPITIDYIECHATGTPVGDIVELNSMEMFFSKYNHSPLLGSVKSNLGHLLTTAGIASLIKVLLSMNKDIIPPTIKINEPLTSKQGKIGGKNIVTTAINWKKHQKIAGVSAFGFGGCNAHLIVEKIDSPQPSLKSREKIEAPFNKEDLRVSNSENQEVPLARDFRQNIAPVKQAVLNKLPNLISTLINRKSSEENNGGLVSNQKLAIIGMDALFGSCDGLDALDRTIYKGIQHFIPLPPQRWQGIDTEIELLKNYGFLTEKVPKGAYIKDFDFDFLRFKIPPKEEDQLIPQQLLMLKVADRAIQDSGLKEGGNIAVIIGMETELSLHQYRGRVDLSWQIKDSLKAANINLYPEEVIELEHIIKDSLHSPAGVNQYTSFIGNLMASRITSQWDFTGPSFTISAGENSVFKALEVAQQMLSNGDVEGVVLGAIDLAGGVESVLLRQKNTSVNTGINTLSFDENCNGWIVGEGAGAIVLKSYEIAKESQDKIYAVIDNCTLVKNHSIYPSSELVKETCKQAFKETNIQPKDIGYLEVFASGIPHENEVEIKGIIAAYQDLYPSEPPLTRGEENQVPNISENFGGLDKLTCSVGSIKANIGHTYAASGIGSLIKTALCLYHRYIPATPNWTTPQQLELWKDSPFYVASESRTWFLEDYQTKRIAAINGLGIDNTYAHLILSEDPIQKERPSNNLQQTPFYLFPINANNKQNLLEKINHFKQKIEGNVDLSKLATETYLDFQKKQPEFYTFSLVGGSYQELLKEIEFAFEGIKKAFENPREFKTPLGSYFTANPLSKQGTIAFVYPGMASSDIRLGKDIFRLFPKLYKNFSNLTNNVGQTLYEKLLYPRNLTNSFKQRKVNTEDFFSNGVAMCQSGISLATLYTQILQDIFKVKPQVAFGYSLGEASAMFFALGVWQNKFHNNSTSASVALKKSPLFQTELCGACLAGRKFWDFSLTNNKKEKFWQSYSLKTSVNQVKEVLKKETKVYLTFINTPEEVVISGDPQSCLKVIEKLNCYYTVINFDSVLHCEIAQDYFSDLLKIHNLPIKNKPDIKFYSSINCQPLLLESHILTDNSAQVCCQTVNFPKIVNTIYENGTRIFIEVGAKSNCTNWIQKILRDKEYLAVSINTKGLNDYTGIIRLLAQLISHGVTVDLSCLYPPISQVFSQDKSLIKKITLGGNIIQQEIFNLENQEKFQRVIYSDFNKKTLTTYNNKDQNNLNYHNDLKINQLQIAVSQQLINDSKLTKSSESNVPLKSAEKVHQIKNYIKPSNIVWNEADLLEFAQGNISNVFGEGYKIIDTYSRRVRLPLHPYLLVTRVTKINAKKGEYKPSSLTTEYDIPYDAWYSVDGQIPGCIAIESGQCDLLLISYLGIDFQNQGNLVYRLLDCTLTFLDELPKEGDTLSYDIKINSFAKSGDNLLFFFSYECFVKDKMIIQMDGGCAGFFSDKQLEQGKGVIVTEKEKEQRKLIQKQIFQPLLVCTKSSFDETDIFKLIQGNLADCFGDHYNQYGLNQSLRLPPQKIMMIDKITSVDTTGGDWGLGLIIAEKQLEPEHWYFPCHFKDDQVLAGSLQSEGCSQLLQFYLLYLGLHTLTKDARFQPIYGLPQIVRCRGQVTPTSAKLIYRLEVKEIGLHPHPYIKCNVEIILNHKIVVHFQDLGLQLVEKNPDDYSSISSPEKLPKPEPITIKKLALLTEEQVQEFCTGSVAKCFGEEFAIYDDGGKVKASRMPNTHLSLVSRVLEVKGKRYKLIKGSSIVTEYDVPYNPWYYRQNSYETTPYSILMEIALQPCGFLSAYLGTTLLYPDQSLYFRNLDGNGIIIKDIDIRGKTIANNSTLVSTSNIQGMILQSFNFELICDGEIFYKGWASFGHFSLNALANQVGLDMGNNVLPWYKKENALNLPEININLRSQESRNKYYQINPNKPYYRLSQNQLDLLNEVKIIAKGGRYQQGYIYGRKDIKLTDWYFKCHFHQDPVMPGSLGVEAMLQAMQIWALYLDLAKDLKNPCFNQLLNHKILWKYRGQIPPDQLEMYLEIHISKIDVQLDKVMIIGDGSLWKPNMRIYEVKDLAICLINKKNYHDYKN